MKSVLTTDDFEQPTILIKLNKTYKPGDSEQLLYEYTRAYWRMSLSRATSIKYVIPLYQGTVLEVFEPEAWYPAKTTQMLERKDVRTAEEVKGRIEFVGKVAPDEIREKYIGKNAVQNLPWGQGPFIYVGENND